ncbi:hypothetical protein B0J11DRAFT_610172 [Dendryphion nanum]|uniref:Apple domain-containing protein n=1 Tax=Dendryphion nanum TaxID=256645 RepID=A0A9P9J267_9PLEO|nr:hypothetical protein B0J11DRAFT_610172 [Dendryphion nanum]
MGVRSLLTAVFLLAVLINIFGLLYSSKSHQTNSNKAFSKRAPSRNPGGGPINGYPVIKSFTPRNEADEELLYDPTTCGLENGEVRTLHGRQFQIECGVYHTGGEYKEVHSETVLECMTLCAMEVECIALAFYQNSANNNCFLKDTLPPPRLTKGARHRNIVGAKVIGGTLEPPTLPIPDPKPVQPACTLTPPKPKKDDDTWWSGGAYNTLCGDLIEPSYADSSIPSIFQQSPISQVECATYLFKLQGTYMTYDQSLQKCRVINDDIVHNVYWGMSYDTKSYTPECFDFTFIPDCAWPLPPQPTQT